jgi:Mg2+/Co2+ transporter CorB
MLTARGDLDDQPKFARHMRKFGMDIDKDIHVRRAGNLQGMKPADSKARVISDLIKKHGYKKINLYDDSLDNIKGMLKLKSEHPDVEFHGHHVQHDHETGQVKITKHSYVPKGSK